MQFDRLRDRVRGHGADIVGRIGDQFGKPRCGGSKKGIAVPDAGGKFAAGKERRRQADFDEP